MKNQSVEKSVEHSDFARSSHYRVVFTCPITKKRITLLNKEKSKTPKKRYSNTNSEKLNESTYSLDNFSSWKVKKPNNATIRNSPCHDEEYLLDKETTFPMFPNQVGTNFQDSRFIFIKISNILNIFLIVNMLFV